MFADANSVALVIICEGNASLFDSTHHQPPGDVALYDDGNDYHRGDGEQGQDGHPPLAAGDGAEVFPLLVQELPGGVHVHRFRRRMGNVRR